ncbi:MAG: hypothetical protein PHZ00_07825 [Candidatus Peribacteraceae bacterium]|nr:hypothetical protein [Candidatus Peribacteraceae bacterium]
MAPASTTFHVRLPLKLKNDAQKIAERNGIDLPTAVRIFFSQLVINGTVSLQWKANHVYSPSFIRELKKLAKDSKNITGPMTPDEAIHSLHLG